MLRISRWLLAVGVLLGIGLLTPSIAEAQLCETCDEESGICDGSADDPDDMCHQGIDWVAGELYCSSWGSIMDCDRLSFIDIGPDGALPGVARFAAAVSESGDPSTHGSELKYIRDCKSRIVVRSYLSEQAADMRRRTESIEI
ncbi:hypothetical protein [Candidatus Palauibacter sp.]|uniref:hypothetical protein n=1 Tax=Candidatus Palauibacter sp. TaxID=3101350 RepID=UPI003B5168EB